MGVSDDAVLVEQARSIAAQLDGRWFADFDELCGFAEILAAAGFLVSPVDVVEFFRRPWRYSAEHEVWQRCGRPSEVRGAAGEVLVALFGCRRPRRSSTDARPVSALRWGDDMSLPSAAAPAQQPGARCMGSRRGRGRTWLTMTRGRVVVAVQDAFWRLLRAWDSASATRSSATRYTVGRRSTPDAGSTRTQRSAVPGGMITSSSPALAEIAFTGRPSRVRMAIR